MTQSHPDKPQSNPKTQSEHRPPAFENQGEGDRKSAERYNSDVQRMVEKANYEHKAREAARALDSHEGPELRRAEEKGKARAKEEDPQLDRNFKKPSH